MCKELYFAVVVESGRNHNHNHTTQVVVCNGPSECISDTILHLMLEILPLTLPSRFFYCLEVANKGGIALGMGSRNLGFKTPLMGFTCRP